MENLFLPYNLSARIIDAGYNKQPYFNHFVTDSETGEKRLFDYEKDILEDSDDIVIAPLYQQALDYIEETMDCCIMTFFNTANDKWGFRVFPLKMNSPLQVFEDKDENDSSPMGLGTCSSRYSAYDKVISTMIDVINYSKSSDYQLVSEKVNEGVSVVD